MTRGTPTKEVWLPARKGVFGIGGNAGSEVGYAARRKGAGYFTLECPNALRGCRTP